MYIVGEYVITYLCNISIVLYTDSPLFGSYVLNVQEQGQKVFWSPSASAKASETQVVH